MTLWGERCVKRHAGKLKMYYTGTSDIVSTYLA
jgi:hypothetical protein